MDSRTIFARLRDHLATLYSDKASMRASTRRVVADAGLDMRRLAFSTHALNNWHAILTEAEKQNKLQPVIQIACAEFPEYQPLIEVCQVPLDLQQTKQPTAASGRHLRLVEPLEPEPPLEIRQRYALFIGVRDYVDPNYRPLPHTVYDVVELAKVLVDAGYLVRALHSDQVDPQLQPTRDNIWGELENLIAQTGPGDLLLVHFGCHGDLSSEQAYLVTHQARRPSLQRTAIDLDELKNRLANAPAQARILILDACHSGIGRSADGMDAEFERHIFLEAAGSATLAACRQNQLAYEHDQSSHGAFTYFLLEGLRGAAGAGQRYITFHQLNNYVTDQVKRWALQKGLQQWPNASTQLVGDPPLLALPAPTEVLGPSFPPNPFSATLAIRDPAGFIGRTAELRRLKTMLQNGSVALLGEPKIGKSSLLWQLAQDWPDTVIGPLDCHAISDCDDFYAQLAEALDLADSEWRTIRAALRQRAALLLLDEFDNAADWGLTSEHLRRLRALCGQNNQLHLVTTSRLPLKEIYIDSGRGSPAYNFLIPMTLGPLTEPEARQVLAHPWALNALAFDTGACQQVLELAQTHPFRLQRAAFHRYEALTEPTYDWQAAYLVDMEHLQ